MKPLRRKPVVIARNGRGRAVVQDLASCEDTQESLALLEIVAQGRADVRDGKVKPFTQPGTSVPALSSRAERSGVEGSQELPSTSGVVANSRDPSTPLRSARDDRAGLRFPYRIAQDAPRPGALPTCTTFSRPDCKSGPLKTCRLDCERTIVIRKRILMLLLFALGIPTAPGWGAEAEPDWKRADDDFTVAEHRPHTQTDLEFLREHTGAHRSTQRLRRSRRPPARRHTSRPACFCGGERDVPGGREAPAADRVAVTWA